jgi:hypothetical protein
MCVCDCTHDEIHTPLVPGSLLKPGLFNWVTIVLLTGWILVVAVAANNAQVELKSEPSTVQAFIERQL